MQGTLSTCSIKQSIMQALAVSRRDSLLMLRKSATPHVIRPNQESALARSHTWRVPHGPIQNHHHTGVRPVGSSWGNGGKAGGRASSPA